MASLPFVFSGQQRKSGIFKASILRLVLPGDRAKKFPAKNRKAQRFHLCAFLFLWWINHLKSGKNSASALNISRVIFLISAGEHIAAVNGSSIKA